MSDELSRPSNSPSDRDVRLLDEEHGDEPDGKVRLGSSTPQTLVEIPGAPGMADTQELSVAEIAGYVSSSEATSVAYMDSAVAFAPTTIPMNDEQRRKYVDDMRPVIRSQYERLGLLAKWMDESDGGRDATTAPAGRNESQTTPKATVRQRRK